MVFGIVFIIIGFYLRSKRMKLLRIGVKVDGTVTHIRKEKSKDSTVNNNIYVFKPVIDFEANGKPVSKISKIYSNPCPYKVGDKVTVTYNPDDIDDFTLNDGPALTLEIFFFGAGILIWLIAAGYFIFKK